MKREGKELLAAALLAGAAACLFAGSRWSRSFAEGSAALMTPLRTAVLGRITGVLPLSVAECLLYGVLAALLIRGIRLLLSLAGKGRGISPRQLLREGLTRSLLLLSLFFFLYEAGEDLYFYVTPFSRVHGYGSEAYSDEALMGACRFLVTELKTLSEEVERDGEGCMQLAPGAGERAVSAMKKLGEIYPELAGSYSVPKPVLLSLLMSHTNLAGIYTAFTCEANYNRDMTAYNIPFTMCHEMSHEKGILMEDEANFTAFLACIGAEDPDIRYSGLLSGWVYCGNELFKRDRAYWSELSGQLPPAVMTDLDSNTAFWSRYRTPVAKSAVAFNDTYLRSHGQKDGAASYDRVVDLIISYGLTEKLFTEG